MTDGAAQTVFIGVAGGSGAGKSTLCERLQRDYPHAIGLLQLDDYFRPAATVPEMAGHKNWDHPDALDWQKMLADMAGLANGQSIVARTKNARLNPAYSQTNKRIDAVFEPRPLYLVEGYLVLHEPRVRAMLTDAIWLELDHATRWQRRVHFKLDGYERDVLQPMQAQFVEPSRTYARHVVDVSNKTADDIFALCLPLVQHYLLPS